MDEGRIDENKGKWVMLIERRVVLQLEAPYYSTGVDIDGALRLT